MEPMDFDDDNNQYSSQPAVTCQKKGYSGNIALPWSSPFASQTSWPQGSPLLFGHHEVLSSSSSVFGRAKHSTPMPYKSRSNSGINDSLFRGSSPHSVQSNFCGRVTPLLGLPENRKNTKESVNSDAGSCDSMETSDRSDISEMEVVQSSPSSSWDLVRAQLSQFSLFKNDSENMQPTEPTEPASKERGNKEIPSSCGSRFSWEPTLSVGQAAAAFKRGRKGRTSSSSPSARESAGRPITPVIRSGKQDLEKTHHGEFSHNLQLNAKARHCEKSGHFSCGFCLALTSILLVILVGICSYLLHRQEITYRRKFVDLDAELLRNEMMSEVFGQHIANDIVPSSIEKYLQKLHAESESCNNDSSCFVPPLILSFHGWTGVGKNFVSSIITNLFPVKTVRKFLIPYHFPHLHLDGIYESQIEEWILSNVTQFSVNFFIFDEMDKATEGVIQGIQAAVAKLHQQNSFKSPSVFFFLSNLFGEDINQIVFQALAKGKERESLTLSDFEKLFVIKDTWYRKFALSDAHFVAVPFLPLEKQHIVQCIRQDLVSKKLSTYVDIISHVLQELSFLQLPSGQEFSQTGCKRVSDKVNLVAFS